MKTRIKSNKRSNGSEEFRVEVKMFGPFWGVYRLVNLKEGAEEGSYVTYDGPTVEYKTLDEKEAHLTSTWISLNNTLCGSLDGKLMYLFLDEMDDQGRMVYRGSEKIKDALEAYKRRYRIM